MTSSSRDYRWLPEHQLEVASTLAHVNELIASASNAYNNYIQASPIVPYDVVAGDTVHMKVRRVVPPPAALARYTADALNQLRSAIEHTIFAEVEQGLGRPLTREERRRLEMPVFTDAAKFDSWLKQKKRPELEPLRSGSPLVERMRALQPYQRQKKVEEHPLRLLAEYTNHAKHQAPVRVVTQIVAVVPSWSAPSPKTVEAKLAGPARPEDVLASTPRGTVVPYDIWPTVTISRPHLQTWAPLMRELADIEEWVRVVAVPHLILGVHDVDPLPPQLDTTAVHEDIRAALAAAGQIPAAQRLSRGLQAILGRDGLVEILLPEDPSAPVRSYVASLTDDDILDRLDRLADAVRDPAAATALVRKFLTEARQLGTASSPMATGSPSAERS